MSTSSFSKPLASPLGSFINDGIFYLLLQVGLLIMGKAVMVEMATVVAVEETMMVKIIFSCCQFLHLHSQLSMLDTALLSG